MKKAVSTQAAPQDQNVLSDFLVLGYFILHDRSVRRQLVNVRRQLSWTFDGVERQFDLLPIDASNGGEHLRPVYLERFA